MIRFVNYWSNIYVNITFSLIVTECFATRIRVMKRIWIRVAKIKLIQTDPDTKH